MNRDDMDPLDRFIAHCLVVINLDDQHRQEIAP